jgi:hypothetical protein
VWDWHHWVQQAADLAVQGLELTWQQRMAAASPFRCVCVCVYMCGCECSRGGEPSAAGGISCGSCSYGGSDRPPERCRKAMTSFQLLQPSDTWLP